MDNQDFNAINELTRDYIGVPDEKLLNQAKRTINQYKLNKEDIEEIAITPEIPEREVNIETLKSDYLKISGQICEEIGEFYKRVSKDEEYKRHLFVMPLKSVLFYNGKNKSTYSYLESFAQNSKTKNIGEFFQRFINPINTDSVKKDGEDGANPAEYFWTPVVALYSLKRLIEISKDYKQYRDSTRDYTIYKGLDKKFNSILKNEIEETKIEVRSLMELVSRVERQIQEKLGIEASFPLLFSKLELPVNLETLPLNTLIDEKGFWFEYSKYKSYNEHSAPKLSYNLAYHELAKSKLIFGYINPSIKIISDMYDLKRKDNNLKKGTIMRGSIRALL